jgi:prepilin-type N-terminal cleavage/methylation domain-containing protein
VKKGFSLVELLVALAIFGLLAAAILSGLLGIFRVNRSAGAEARAVVVAKDYLERARKKGDYSGPTLSLPPFTQTGGFKVAVRAGGRLTPSQSASLEDCTGDPTTGYTCSVSCAQGASTVACSLLAVELTLQGSGRTYTFYREWRP